MRSDSYSSNVCCRRELSFGSERQLLAGGNSSAPDSETRNRRGKNERLNMKEDLADRIKLDAEVFDRQAPKYGKAGDDLLHAIPAEAEELYRQDLRDVLGPFGEYKSVLEVGAGTGLFTRLLGRWGCKGITGIDISG